MKTTSSLEAVPRAFTLIELLVVIVVILVCVSLLVPTLARTRPNVKTAQCLNNLKQWGTAMQLYVSNNADNLPRDGLSSSGAYPGAGSNGTPTDPNAWFNVWPQLIGDKGLMDYFNGPGGNLMAKFPFPGGRGPVWHCPSAYMSTSDYSALSGGGADGFFSYEMNIDLKRQDASTSVAYPGMPKLTAFQKPSATVLFFDCAFNPRTEIVNSSPQFNSVNPAGRYRSFFARHGNGGSIVFLDGRAKVFSAYYVTNGAGTFEPPEPDVIWNAPYRALSP